MRKTEFDTVIRSLGMYKRIGTYDFLGEQCDLFSWQNYLFYYGDDGRTFIAGKFPLPISYQIFKNLIGNDGFTLEGERREWRLEKCTPDKGVSFEPDYYHESISEGFNKTFSVTSIEDFFEIVISIENYRRLKAGLELLPEEKIEEYTEDTKMTQEANDRINSYYVSKRRKNFRRSPRTSKNWPLKIELNYLDSAINPLEGGRFTLDDYKNYTKRIAISIEHPSPNEMRVVYAPPSGLGVTTYEITKEYCIYDSTNIVDDITFKRFRHMYTEHTTDDHMSGEIIEVLSGVTKESEDQTPSFDFIYNLTENMICKDGEWSTPTPEDMRRIFEEVHTTLNLVSSTILDCMMPAGRHPNFEPIN